MTMGIIVEDRELLLPVLERAKQERRLTGFTSGVFDILHAGHVEYLQRAKEQVDILLVGVNSDESTRQNKGPDRPIHPERERLEVLAALQAVDYAFIFNERNTQTTIALLRPDRYIKGGDYLPSTLSSTPLVESYGGRVIIIPYRAGCSTTKTISRIAAISAAASSITLPPYDPRPAVFLDRDGTLIEHVDYLHEPLRVRVLEGAIEAVGRLRQAGFRAIVVTNQPGIGIGYFSEDDFFRVNKVLLRAASQAGVLFDRIYYCPHSKGDGCPCRKPAIGMIERAGKELSVDISRSIVIGDMTCDIALARNAGCRSVLVRTGRAGSDGEFEVLPDFVADDLAAAASLILQTRLS